MESINENIPERVRKLPRNEAGTKHIDIKAVTLEHQEAIIKLPSQGITLSVKVGKGGNRGPFSSTQYGGGAGGGWDGDNSGGQGGGRSAIRINLSGTIHEIMTAGGGGGGGFSGIEIRGGAGGGLIGEDGYPQNQNERGGGGTQTTGGTAGDGVIRDGNAGTQYNGGSASTTSGWGAGGGGGGWYGGGGGGGSDGLHAAGGGGSGFVGRSGNTTLSGTDHGTSSTYEDTTYRKDTINTCLYKNTKCLRASTTATPNNTDDDYIAQGGYFALKESNGLVVITAIYI
eukprot:762832-Hanusia_phi.AAC.1